METKQKTTLTQGSVARGMLLFALPIFISNLFQQLYNAADSLIVGNFLGGEALAAVGSSGSLIFLLTGFVNGVSLGAGVVVARYFGAKDWDRMRRIRPELCKFIAHHRGAGPGGRRRADGDRRDLNAADPALDGHAGRRARQLHRLLPHVLHRLNCRCHVQRRCKHSAIRRRQQEPDAVLLPLSSTSCSI